MELKIVNERFPGYVVLPDAFGWKETRAYYGMMREISDKEPEDAFYLMLPGLIEIVQEWHIQGWPEHPTVPEDIPCKPFPQVINVLGAIYRQIQDRVLEDAVIPLELSQPPTEPPTVVRRVSKSRNSP